MKIIKQKLQFEESLKQRLEFICEFSKVTPTFINGSIRKLDKTNLTYIELHLYETADGRVKRFFDEKDIQKFFSEWKKLYIHEETMGRYGAEKVLWRGALKVNK